LICTHEDFQIYTKLAYTLLIIHFYVNFVNINILSFLIFLNKVYECSPYFVRINLREFQYCKLENVIKILIFKYSKFSEIITCI